MGTQLAKDLSDKAKVSNSEGQTSTIQYQLQNVIMDGDTTTIAHFLHDKVRRPGNCSVVGCGSCQEGFVWASPTA